MRLLFVLTLSACATVSVPPGHAAVVLKPDGGLSLSGEGVTDVPPLSHVDDFDLTQQVQGGSFSAVTADGVPLAVRDPTIVYNLVPGELLVADREIGPRGARAIVEALVRATIAAVLAEYRWDQLDTPHLRQAQERITVAAAARLRPYHLALGAVELKGVSPKLPGLAAAVTAISVWEQRGASAQSRLQVARDQADGLRARAAGIAAGYRAVAPTLTPAVLADKQNRAWEELLTSPRTAVQLANSPVEEVLP